MCRFLFLRVFIHMRLRVCRYLCGQRRNVSLHPFISTFVFGNSFIKFVCVCVTVLLDCVFFLAVCACASGHACGFVNVGCWGQNLYCVHIHDCECVHDGLFVPPQWYNRACSARPWARHRPHCSSLPRCAFDTIRLTPNNPQKSSLSGGFLGRRRIYNVIISL